MKALRVLIRAILLVLVAGTLAPEFAQNASSGGRGTDEDHVTLLGLLRTINTAEVTDFATYGSFSSWQTLAQHQSNSLNGWLARFYSSDPNVHFRDMQEILPGWNLRLNVQADGKGYVVVLEDARDKSGYAALSDERGVIRECRYLR